jgi:hypothetical protein
MLETRYVAGKWIYRVPGALVWSYSRTDAIEHSKHETQDVRWVTETLQSARV